MRTIARLVTMVVVVGALAWPGTASAQPVGHCEEIEPPASAVLSSICVSVEANESHATVMVTTNADTKWIVTVDESGLWVCRHTGSTDNCIVEPG